MGGRKIQSLSYCLMNPLTGLDNTEKVEQNLASMKGRFTENQGQIENTDVKYVYAGSDVSIGFIESGYLIKLTNEENLTSVVKVIFDGGLGAPGCAGGRERTMEEM